MVSNYSKISRGAGNVIVVAILVIGLSAVAAFGYKWFKQPSINVIVEMTPDNAVGFGVLRGGPQMAMDFHLWELSGILKEEQGDGIADSLKKVKDTLGFDPTSKTGILNSGFDIFEPLAFSVHMVSMDQPAIAVYLPVSNREKVQTMIDEALAEIEVPAEMNNFNNIDLYSVMDGVVRYAFYNDHLVAVAANNPEDSNDLMKNILDGENGLSENDQWLKGMKPLIDGNWDLLVLANANEARNTWGALLKDEAFAAVIDKATMASIQEAEAVGFAVDLEPDSLRYKARYTVVENATVKANHFLGNYKDTLAQSIPGNPIGSFRVAFDMERVLETVRSSPSSAAALEQVSDELRNVMGMDLEKDILSRIGSPMSLAIVDGQSDATQNFGGAFWLPLKDGHQLDHSLENVSDMLAESAERPEEETVGETQWSRLEMEGMKMAWAIHQDHLVFTFGDIITDKVVSGVEGPSFLDSVKRADVRQYLEEKGYAATYINLGELVNTFRAELADAPPQARIFLDSLDIAYGHASADETSAESEFVITAKESSNFAEVIKGMLSAPQ